MSPKETYIINISSLESNETGQNDPKDRVIRKIMQNLFIDPYMNDLSNPLSPTNCHFVLNVSKASVSENPSLFFVPKLRFNLSKRGSQFKLNLRNSEIVNEEESIYLSAPHPFKAVFCTDSEKCGVRNGFTDLLDTIEA